MSDDGCGTLVFGIFIGVLGTHLYDEYIAEKPPEIEIPSSLIASEPVRRTVDMPITAFDSKTAWILDVSTVSGPRDARQGWVKADHSQDSTTAARYTMSLWRVNCDTTEYQTLERVAYSPDKTPSVLPAFDEKKFAVPDSNAFAVVEELCHEGFDQPLKK